MEQHFPRLGRTRGALYLAAIGLLVGFGAACPVDEENLNPSVAPGNRPPRLIITDVASEDGDTIGEQGETFTISFSGEDGEDVALVRIFASVSPDPTPAQEVPILNNFPIGPGAGSGVAFWDTTLVSPDTYNIFGEIDDQTVDPFTGSGNPPVRVMFTEPISLAPQGTEPLPTPPELTFIDPEPNLGLSVQDEVTIRYTYVSPTNPVTVTLLLDRDLNPNNDDVNNPGDPFDPNTNIIILPSAPRNVNDPTFDGDPPPPDDPNNPPTQPDSLEIRRNPRTLDPTIFPELKEYRFVIDFTQIPVSTQPLFIRATFDDGNFTRHSYAIGSLTISGLASGVVDAEDLGFSLAGARIQGFSALENLGTDFIVSDDIDLDGNDDFMILARFASPRFRVQPGAAYLVHGRRKTPFPPDTNDNGLPDVPDPSGGVIDFPEPPPYLTDPYDAANVGRFGGTLNINSVTSFFRGTLYAMPEPHDDAPLPPTLDDLLHPDARSAGLTSVATIDMTGDGVPDLVFGLPFVSGATDHDDDDPADGCDLGYIDGGDVRPNNQFSTLGNAGDDIMTPFKVGFQAVDQGLVIMVDGTNNVDTIFNRFVDAGLAGQFNNPFVSIDDEGNAQAGGSIPEGMRFRGAWFEAQDFAFPWYSDAEFGHTVARLPDFDNVFGDELMISSPGYDPLGGFTPDGIPVFPPQNSDVDRGRIMIWLTDNYIDDGIYDDSTRSLPTYTTCPIGTCIPNTDPSIPIRCIAPMPNNNTLIGEQVGDRFGFAKSAGDFDQDGTTDIVAGAPGADRNNLVDPGIAYIIKVPQGGFGDTDMATNPTVTRLEIIGTHNNDRFGRIQEAVQDVNGDGIRDVAFASGLYDDNAVGEDAGFVGVIFGDRAINGVERFGPEQVGTGQLPGVRFVGVSEGAMAGFDIDSAGDFNGDGVGDLLISSPGEIRELDGEQRRGVAYLIFGGDHLINESFSLSQVGDPELPGIVFISRFAMGTLDEAPIDTVGGLGDTDGDGFDDIAIGCPTADRLFSGQRLVDAGEINIVYGSNFGSNNINP